MRFNVSDMWGWLFERYPLTKSRMDRAIKDGTGLPAQDAPAVEVGYGSKTIRVRVFAEKNRMIGFVDFSSDHGLEGEKTAELGKLLDTVGIEPK